MADQRVVLVAALGRNHVIGRDDDLPWRDAEGRPRRLPGDLARFKALTLGHAIVMGRRTYDSIGRALPGRRTIVVTRQPGWSAPGVEVAGSLEAALSAAGPGDVFVVGGGEVYTAAMPLAAAMELTEVDEAPEGDTWFPAYDDGSWRETRREAGEGFAWVSYVRADG